MQLYEFELVREILDHLAVQNLWFAREPNLRWISEEHQGVKLAEGIHVTDLFSDFVLSTPRNGTVYIIGHYRIHWNHFGSPMWFDLMELILGIF